MSQNDPEDVNVLHMRVLGSVGRRGWRQSHETKLTGVRDNPVRGLQPGHQRVIVGKLMAAW